MTALTEFQRLECTGLWRDAPGAQKREVIVSFGDATLVISEARSARAITHWSLPAILRLNPGEAPARYAPAPDGDEELELDDETMVAAIEKVHSLIAARQPHPGRLRNLLLGAVLAVVLGVGIFWMPRALIDHTARALPFSTQQEIGRAALADLMRLTGPPCAGPEGVAALDRLRDRMSGTGGTTLVLPMPLAAARMLPGRILVLPRATAEAGDRPEVVAATILAAEVEAGQKPPIRELLHFAGFRATISLLTAGQLPSGALRGYGEDLLARKVAPPDQPELLRRFSEAGLSSTPYAYALDPTGETTLGLIEADPHRADAKPVMTDTDWVALQGICAE
jgi:hypothetical protein